MKTVESAEWVTGDADLAYVRSNFVALGEACALAGRDISDVYRDVAFGRLPRPAYVLPEEYAYVPNDYFEQAFSRRSFAGRYLDECAHLGVPAGWDEALEAWEGYLSGAYGVCLRRVTPENVALKKALLMEIDGLVAAASDAYDESVRERLAAAVDRLDELERPFSPVYDRLRFGRPVTRDTHITAVRERFGLAATATYTSP